MNGCSFYCNNNNNNQPINPYINSILKYNDNTSNIVIAKGDTRITVTSEAIVVTEDFGVYVWILNSQA